MGRAGSPKPDGTADCVVSEVEEGVTETGEGVEGAGVEDSTGS